MIGPTFVERLHLDLCLFVIYSETVKGNVNWHLDLG